MKKFNITSNNVKTIALTCVVWLCVLIAAAFALQHDTVTPYYIDAIFTVIWLIIAAFFEWIKYKITHNNE